jgi:hypothetical protein
MGSTYKNLNQKIVSPECCSIKGYLTDSEVSKFKHLTRKLIGVKLSKKEAEDQGTRLIMLFELFIKDRIDNL